MKIAIKGHSTRGKEVIQILKSLGGVNKCPLTGREEISYYYINYNYNNIIYCHDNEYVNKYCKKYTLEEFEKEFPFKVGDLCIYQSEYTGDIVVKVLRMIIQDNDIVYEIGHKDTDKTYSGIYRRRDTLKPYKEMKEERNITLTLDKAKEWYKKGGELKEIALQAFSEKELNPLPRNWEEFCEKFPIDQGEAYINSVSKVIEHKCPCNRDLMEDRHACPSVKSAEAHLAMIQLEQLRDCWWNGWEPEYNCGTKYTIKWDKDDLIVATSGRIRAFLIFPTQEMAEEFLKCFRDLIEKAGDLI